jgi:hypothetical protein
MMTYVDGRLFRWGQYVRWLIRGAGTTDPTPKDVRSWWGPVVHDRLVQENSRIASSIDCPVDAEEARETDAAVRKLREIDERLYQVIVECYVKGGTVEQKVAAIGVKSIQTYYNRLQRAQAELLGLMNDATVTAIEAREARMRMVVMQMASRAA